MYGFIFKYFYKYFDKKKDIPHYSAILFVTVAQFSHLFCLLCILKYFDIFFIDLRLDGMQKYYLLPLIVLWIFLNRFYFNKQYIEVFKSSQQYEKDNQSFGYTILVLLVIAVPFAIGAVLLSVKADEVAQGLLFPFSASFNY